MDLTVYDRLFLNTLDENVTTCQVQLFKMVREYLGVEKKRDRCVLSAQARWVGRHIAAR